MNLFDAPRQRFLRPLHGKFRALASQVLARLHEQLFGPTSEVGTLSPEELRELIWDLSASAYVFTADEDDESFGVLERPLSEREREDVVGSLSRQLVEDGWLERYFSDLRPALRFTRAGKGFAAAISDVVQPRRRTRLRNMRSVRNALRQFADRGDPDDLADALHYASAMSAELTDDIQALQDQAREVLRQQDQAFDRLEELNRRMDGDYAPRLLADNVDTHASDIIGALDKLRYATPQRRAELEASVRRELPWLTEEASGLDDSVVDYALNRVHSIVVYGCRPKQSVMVREIQSVTRLMAQIVGHQHFVRAAASTSAMLRLVAAFASGDDASREARLRCFGAMIAPTSVRLMDPMRVQIRQFRQSRHADRAGVDPEISWESRLQDAIEQATAAAVVMDAGANGQDLAEQLRRHGLLYLSALPTSTPQEVLHAVFCLTHVNDVLPVQALTLPHQRADNPFFSSSDLLVQPFAVIKDSP